MILDFDWHIKNLKENIIKRQETIAYEMERIEKNKAMIDYFEKQRQQQETEDLGFDSTKCGVDDDSKN